MGRLLKRWSPPKSKKDSGYLGGRQLSPREVAALCHTAGFRGENLVKAVATCLSESQGYDRAYHDNVDERGRFLSRDCGMFQINIPDASVGSRYERDLYNPAYNARVAYAYFKERGFQPWHGYTRGYALDPNAKGEYIHRAIKGVANFWAEKYGLTPVPYLETRKP